VLSCCEGETWQYCDSSCWHQPVVVWAQHDAAVEGLYVEESAGECVTLKCAEAVRLNLANKLCHY